MRRYGIIAAVFVLLILFSPVLLRKYRVPLVSNGKMWGFAKRPLAFGDKEFAVFSASNEVFALWGDFFDFPVFIHAFADGKRFLCVYDDDTALLVFVVDNSSSKAPTSNEWPPDDYLNGYLTGAVTYVVIRAQGLVRLPTLAEVQEVSSNLVALTQRQYEAVALPTLDLGLYRSYWPKSSLLKDLSPDRKSVWPQ